MSDDYIDTPDLSADSDYVDVDVDDLADPSAQAAFDAVDESDSDDDDEDE